MKALQYQGKHTLRLQDIPEPKIKSDEILMKVRRVGICGTDLHIYNGGTDVKPNTVIGHEFSGDIVKVGKNVRNVKVGDRAVAEHVVNCQVCYFCLRGRPNLCVKAEVLGMDRPGALAEYMAIPARLVYAFPQSMSYDEAALVEPLTIALYAASKAKFLLEKRVAVIGQGPIGILLDQVLSAAGARVVGIDVLKNRLRFAKEKGWIHDELDPTQKDFQKKFNAISEVGVDIAFEAVGKEVTAELCLDITRRHGMIFLLGVFEKPATLNLMRAIKKELKIRGSWTCSFSFPTAIDLVVDHKVDLKSLITHTVPLSRAEKAFKDALSYSDSRIKTIIKVA